MREGSRVRVRRGDRTLEGVVMPSKEEFVVLKLDSGYNVGLKREELHGIEELDTPGEHGVEEEGTGSGERGESREPGEGELSVLSTGGTIASKIDYRTGGVRPGYSAEDLLRAVPELEEVAPINADVVFEKLSENVDPGDWVSLAKRVHGEIEDGAEGVVVTHGTDTMAHTAAALSFMVETPVPVVFTASQRSADRPSSDNVLNAVSAAKFALSDVAEVSVVMHEESSDTTCLAHRGTRVRKMHTSRRDAFRSPNARPLARVGEDVEVLVDEHVRRGEVELTLRDDLNVDVGLVKFYPGMPTEVLEPFFERFDGLVIEGTGLGHVSSDLVSTVREGVASGVTVVMTSQCIHGRVCDRVYETGRDMLDAGVVEGEDMLPGTALVKLMWLLPRADGGKLRRLIKTPLRGELSRRSRSDLF
ncbi:MAG: Glutamyl-tRNA(Gln) amidotransferase subunit D [Methanonatronarchaeales archaeon]|nr:Glutamyl-tRNA(Gln) amidotransferase subunit D [Methanonatronarchaeales archaeon]